MVRIAIVGSRDFPWEIQVRAFVTMLPKDWMVVSGGARGPDRWAENEAKRQCRITTIFHANWERYGKRAGLIRNAAIAKFAHAMVAFWDGESRGTLDSIRLMQKAGKPTYVVSDGDPCPTIERISDDLDLTD